MVVARIKETILRQAKTILGSCLNGMSAHDREFGLDRFLVRTSLFGWGGFRGWTGQGGGQGGALVWRS